MCKHEELDIISAKTSSMDSSRRLPICLAIDVSSSVSMSSKTKLQSGINKFFSVIRTNQAALDTIDLAIITFGTHVRVACYFSTLDKLEIPVVHAGGISSIGEGMERSFGLIKKQIDNYKKSNTLYYSPSLILVSDGISTDSIRKARYKLSDMKEKEQLSLQIIATGDADLLSLAKFSDRQDIVLKRDLDFEILFMELGVKIIRSIQFTLANSRVKNENIYL